MSDDEPTVVLTADEIEELGRLFIEEVCASIESEEVPLRITGTTSIGDRLDGSSTQYARDAEGHEHRGKGPGGGQFVKQGGGGGGGSSGESIDQGSESSAHPGAAYGSSVRVRASKQRAFDGATPLKLKNPLTKQETGRVGEAIVVAWLKEQGFHDARPMNTAATNFPVDLIEDHRPTEVKAGLVSNGRKAQQWRLTFSKESKKEKELYEKMTPVEREAWNAEKQKRIHERKQRVISELQKRNPGKKINPRTITLVINSDTQTADVYVFDGFHDRIDWQSSLSRKSYRGSVTYAH